jgi:hypothetical protein
MEDSMYLIKGEQLCHMRAWLDHMEGVGKLLADIPDTPEFDTVPDYMPNCDGLFSDFGRQIWHLSLECRSVLDGLEKAER